MIAIHGLGEREPEEQWKGVVVNRMPPPYPFKLPYLLRHTAKELAATFYDGGQRYTKIDIATGDFAPPQFEPDRSRAFRKTFPHRKFFVAWCWPLFVRTARASLAAMLGNPTVPEHMKKEVYDCLLSEYDPMQFAPALTGLWRAQGLLQ